MTIFLTDKTALDFWKWKATTLSSLENPVRIRQSRVYGSPNPSSDIRIACSHFRRGDEPISVLVSTNNDLRHSNGIKYHKCSASLAPYSFCRLDRDLYVSTPEHLFVRYAQLASFIELLLIGICLMGTYTVIDGENCRISNRDEPLMKLKSLKKYLSCCRHIPGIANAKKALPYLIEGAESPKEAELALLLSLPKRYGGFNLPKPIFSMQLISKSNTNGFYSLRPDLCWPKAKIAIEYESKTWHSGEERFEQDSLRRNTIRSLGWDVTTVTRKEIGSLDKIEMIAESIRLRMGLKKDTRGNSFDKRLALRSEMNRIEKRRGTTDFWN